MVVRSYAGDGWTLFVRRQPDAVGFVLTVVLAHATGCAVYERRLDSQGLKDHIEELGVDVEVPAFTELLLQTLATRTSVDIVMDTEEEDGDGAVRVVLTYKFSETISRKGQIELECVATNVPLAVATLLEEIHTGPNEPVLSEAQRLQRQTSAAKAAFKVSSDPTKAPSSTTAPMSLSQDSTASTDGEAAVAPTTAVNPHVLKRRHVPTGTVRRKGPRGAKLAKTE